METFKPTNEVEILLKQAAAGAIPIKDPEEDPTKFVPMLFDRDGIPYAAVFTNLSLTSLFKGQLKGIVAMNCGEILARTPPGYGIVINPGYDIGLEINEAGIRNVVADFVRRPA
jgi:hypothetical protein